MTKRKKAPQNPLLYWWNEFLFARYFEYETDLAPDEIARRLRSLQHEREGWIWGLEKTSKIKIHANEKGLDFDIQSRRRRALDPIGITTARAQGTALVDSGSGQTIVQGAVKLGRLFHIFLLAYITITATAVLPLFIRALWLMGNLGDVIVTMIPFFILGAMIAFYWWRIYQDRNDLNAIIELALDVKKDKRATDRLGDGRIYANDGSDENATDEHEAVRRNARRY